MEHEVTGVTLASVRDKLSRRDPVVADPEGRHEAAVALVLVPRVHDLDLLLIRRAERQGDPWSGQMGLPGGRRENRDADLRVTAARETWEEVGVDLGAGELLGQLDDLAPVIQHLPRMLVRPFVFALSARPAIRPSPEVAEAMWTSVGTLPGLRVEEEITVREWQRRVSGFKIGPHLVWGMTERILSHFMDLAT